MQSGHQPKEKQLRQFEYSLESKDGTKPSIGPVILQAAFDDEETRATAMLLLRKDRPVAPPDDYELRVISTDLPASPSPS
jgi:hypothetical protein